MSAPSVKEGSVVQINEEMDPGRKGWIGAFVLVTEVRSWGVVGFVHTLEDHDHSGAAYIRLKWGTFDHIGEAKLVPAPDPEGTVE
jgi:hypothetical protein